MRTRWLHRHLNGNDADAASLPVRVHVGETGAPGTWRDLADWPPPGFAERAWYLRGDGTLAAAPPAAGTLSSFRYDPADPTPSVGGPRMDSRDAGPRRNNALESRQDVLVFTSEPLTEPLDVIGPVSFRVRARGSTPHFDVFARLCDVDPKGTSWNICDGLQRLGGEPRSSDGCAGADGGWQDVTVPMSATAHRFGAGHRLRVQVSGGAHPRFMRNTGTGEPLATATRLVPVEIEISDGLMLSSGTPRRASVTLATPSRSPCRRPGSAVRGAPRPSRVRPSDQGILYGSVVHLLSKKTKRRVSNR